jgi:hypothetical protein
VDVDGVACIQNLGPMLNCFIFLNIPPSLKNSNIAINIGRFIFAQIFSL